VFPCSCGLAGSLVAENGDKCRRSELGVDVELALVWRRGIRSSLDEIAEDAEIPCIEGISVLARLSCRLEVMSDFLWSLFVILGVTAGEPVMAFSFVTRPLSRTNFEDRRW
jgi:hypothetical protein